MWVCHLYTEASRRTVNKENKAVLAEAAFSNHVIRHIEHVVKSRGVQRCQGILLVPGMSDHYRRMAIIVAGDTLRYATGNRV